MCIRDRPTEGTILTVARVASEEAASSDAADVPALWDVVLTAGQKALDDTPNLDVYKRQESRSLRTANGIEVKIPTELLNAESEVEFLHADDGSISLLIKNVIL